MRVAELPPVALALSILVTTRWLPSGTETCLLAARTIEPMENMPGCKYSVELRSTPLATPLGGRPDDARFEHVDACQKQDGQI